MYSPPIRLVFPLLVTVGPYGSFLGKHLTARKAWPIRALNIDEAWRAFVVTMVDAGY